MNHIGWWKCGPADRISRCAVESRQRCARGPQAVDIYNVLHDLFGEHISFFFCSSAKRQRICASAGLGTAIYGLVNGLKYDTPSHRIQSDPGPVRKELTNKQNENKDGNSKPKEPNIKIIIMKAL